MYWHQINIKKLITIVVSHVGVMLIRAYFAVSIPKNCIEARMGPEIYFFVIIYKSDDST